MRPTSPEIRASISKGASTLLLLAGAGLLGFSAWQRFRTEKWHKCNGIVDEVSEDSFPASDPPPWSGAHTI